MTKFTIIISLLVSAVYCYGANIYSHPYNNFSSLHKDRAKPSNFTISISDKSLELTNLSDTAFVLNDTTKLPLNYRYTVKFSNINNKENKAIRITDAQGKSKSIVNTHWGIAFDIQPCGDMFTVDLSCNNDAAKNYSENYDTSIRTMTMSLNKISKGNTTCLEKINITKDANLYTGDNTLSVDLRDNMMRIFLGASTPQLILEKEIKRPNNTNTVGIYCGQGSKIDIKQTKLKFSPDKICTNETNWSKETLEKHLAQSTDPIEGFWQYLDRDMDDKTLRLGGKYTIAIVKNEDGYDIIYINGATVKKSNWKPYMLKGHMETTIFSNVYKGSWIDTSFREINDDVQANVENGVILTFRFPVFKSQLRFSKVLDPIVVNPTSGL